MKLFKAFAAVLATAALAMGTVTAGQAAGKTLTVGAIVKPISLAADQAEYGNRVWFYQSTYDSLLRQKENGDIIPGVATKWTYNSAQTVLTLDLRSGIKFTDGSALDAAAVVKNLNANKNSKGPTANYLASMKSATAKGTSQVVITLSATDPAFVNYLANTAGLLASPKAIGKASAATAPVGSGPYILDKAKTRSGSKYVYTANPNYWDKANRKYDNLVINIYEDQTAMVNALKSGAVQAGNVADPASANTLKKAGLKSSASYLDAKGIYFSDRSGKNKSCIAKKEVRQAINLVFDRPALIKSLESGAGSATTQYFPTYNAGYSKSLDSMYPYDVASAKGLMAAAGYSKGCTITMPTFAPYFGEAVYSIISSQLGKIGITVKEVAEGGSTFIDNIIAGKYDAYLMQFERSGEPWQMMNFMLTSNATFNTDGYAKASVTKLIADYKKATSSKRPAILKAINKAVQEDAWFAVWYAKQANFVYKGVTIKAPQTGNIIPFLYNIR
jgi:peptide/nickel transport system substrate-binding protein